MNWGMISLPAIASQLRHNKEQAWKWRQQKSPSPLICPPSSTKLSLYANVTLSLNELRALQCPQHALDILCPAAQIGVGGARIQKGLVTSSRGRGNTKQPQPRLLLRSCSARTQDIHLAFLSDPHPLPLNARIHPRHSSSVHPRDGNLRGT